jgi:hypothetical protein
MPEITVALPEMDSDSFTQDVINAAARQLLTRYSYDEDGDPHAIPTELSRRLREHMEDVIREQAKEFAPIVAATILEEGVKETNTWGDATGRSRPLKSVIADEVKKELSHSNGRRGEGVLNMMIREEIQKQLRGELHAMVEQAREPILAAMREEATAVFERAMRKALPGVEF